MFASSQLFSLLYIAELLRQKPVLQCVCAVSKYNRASLLVGVSRYYCHIQNYINRYDTNLISAVILLYLQKQNKQVIQQKWMVVCFFPLTEWIFQCYVLPLQIANQSQNGCFPSIFDLNLYANTPTLWIQICNHHHLSFFSYELCPLELRSVCKHFHNA